MKADQRVLTANPGAAPPAAATIIDPKPLAVPQRSWTWWLGAAISLAVLVVSVRELARVDLSEVMAMVPASPAFWLVFALAYFVPAATDFAIFRRLWRIPADGFTALVRKMIGNELLLGYVGEVYFYTWARRRTEMVSTPFGAIKDVAILSALMGNAVTLVMLVVAAPLLATLSFGIEAKTLAGSIGVVLVTSSLLIFFRKALFSLPGADLRFAGMMHLVRILVSTALVAVCWHLVLPQVALQWWLMLAACRLLLSRLPLMPNKDIVFAGLAVFMIGHDAEIGALMTMMASITLAAHLALGLVLSLVEPLGMKR
ncbi:hypothetical protein FHS79_002001 [Polymorphobacter multimanifer]|uniref:Flippase-like domain-containing protein n=1 Tax=Polymorphobacter multimanifer TaxID=1070431 RepID=A0A841L5X4_9SPHN|nr:hypothetical protein [Polymorphobacter multimanifer]MBB6227820.1 hypothetical protein [Polymorphobacter multimanifer]